MTNPILERALQAIKDKDLNQAQALLAEALIENSNDVDAWMMLADILPADQAHESLERVLQIEPGHVEARNRLGLPAIEAPSEESETAAPTEDEPSSAPGFELQAQPEPSEETEPALEDLIAPEVIPAVEEISATVSEEAEPDVDFMNLFMNEEDKAEEISNAALETEAAEIPPIEAEPDHEITEAEIEALLAGMGEDEPVPASDPDFDAILAALAPDNVEGEEKNQPAEFEEERVDEAAIAEAGLGLEAASAGLEPEIEAEDAGDFFSNLFETATGEPEAEVEGEPETLAASEAQESQTQAFALDEAEESLADMFAVEVEPDDDGSSFSLEEDENESETDEEIHPPEKKKRRSHRRSRKGLWITLAVLATLLATIVGGFSWYYFYGPCGVQLVIDTDYALMDVTSRWDESMMIATRSSRVVLAEPLRRMFDIRRELDKTDVPGCLLPAKSSLQKSMYYTLDAYDKLFKYESEMEITKRFTLASQQRRLFETQIDAVRYCAPLACP